MPEVVEAGARQAEADEGDYTKFATFNTQYLHDLKALFKAINEKGIHISALQEPALSDSQIDSLKSVAAVCGYRVFASDPEFSKGTTGYYKVINGLMIITTMKVSQVQIEADPQRAMAIKAHRKGRRPFVFANVHLKSADQADEKNKTIHALAALAAQTE